MKRKLKSFWVPLLTDEFLGISNIETEIRDFGNLLPNGDDESLIEKNGSSLEKALFFFARKSLDQDIHLDIKVVARGRKNFSICKGDRTGEICRYNKLIKYEVEIYGEHIHLDKIEIKISTCGGNQDLRFLMDCYGFVFIDVGKENQELKSIYDNFKKEGVRNILTEHQRSLFQTTLLNNSLKIKNFEEDFIEDDLNERLDQFFKEIAVDADYSKNALIESMRSDYIRDNYSNCLDQEELYKLYLEMRTYEMPYLYSLRNELREQDKQNSSVFNSKNWLEIASLQDRIETLSMERFLTVATSEKYTEEMIKNIISVREGLVSKIVFLTENKDGKELGELADKASKWREERIERYVEYVVSEITTFLKLDKLLKNSFYHKIGNTTYFNTVSKNETIDKLSSYHYWQSVLRSLSENASSLKSILDLYHNKRILSETHDLNYRQASLQDNKLIQHALGGDNHKTYSLSEDAKKLMTFFASLIAFATLIATIVPIIPVDEKDTPTRLIWFFGLLLFSIVILWFLFRKVVRNLVVPDKIWLYTPFNYINYRSKHELQDESDGKIEILCVEHKDGDDFVFNVKELFSKKFLSHGESSDLIPENLKKISNTNIIVSRENPHKRHVELSFTFNPSEEDRLSTGNGNLFTFQHCDKEEGEKKSIKDSISEGLEAVKNYTNENWYVHFVIVYSFSLRDEGKGKFNIYKDSVRLYYSIKYEEPRNKESIDMRKLQESINKLDIAVGRGLYCTYIKPYHSETKKQEKDSKESSQDGQDRRMR